MSGSPQGSEPRSYQVSQIPSCIHIPTSLWRGWVSMASLFRWEKFDLASRLPDGWQEDVAAAARCADVRGFPRTPILSREAGDVSQIRRGRVHADHVQAVLPWLL